MEIAIIILSFAIIAVGIATIFNGHAILRCKNDIRKLIRDIQLLEGTQERFSEYLMKITELHQRLNSLEWHVSNLNALHPVRYEPTVTDKPDPLNPSGIMYDTNTTELKQ